MKKFRCEKCDEVSYSSSGCEKECLVCGVILQEVNLEEDLSDEILELDEYDEESIKNPFLFLKKRFG